MSEPEEILSAAETKEKPTISAAETGPIDQDAITGSLLDGRYLVKQKLGQGGFGVVYLAADQRMLSRPVVVKTLLDKQIRDEWSVRKFKQEMEALARMDHPSIVGIFDTGQLPDGLPYIVMQYVDGSSLRSLISPEGMDFYRAANFVRQIGRALGAAHERGILHRDLKPENIMVQTLADGEEQVKIIDFGIAKIKNSAVALSTADNRSPGTVAYMSPEQLTAGTISPASDVYCFAVIAYELLTGKRPINPDSTFQLLELQRAGVQIKPTDLRPNLPAAAEAAILKCLSFESKDRYQRARDFGDVLASALLGDDEQTKVQTSRGQSAALIDREAETLPPETAHVLFMDIVGYSKSLMDQQRTQLNQLQQTVMCTNEGRQMRQDNPIRLPTGDGMALVFFGDEEAPVRCAIEISRALREQPGIELRMGIHSGFVYRMADINTNLNVAGSGINIAQRVMDCGDNGHLLVSKRVAEDLVQLARWSDLLHDLGEVEVKHGLRVHVFNLYGEDFGNPTRPAKFSVPTVPARRKKTPVIVAGATIALALIVGGIWYAFRPKPSQPTRPETIAAVGTQRSLTYWLTVQKILNKKPLDVPFESAGDNIFGNGWRFRFNLRPMQSGALYMLGVGPGKTGPEEYNVLFPLPEGDQLRPNLAANQTVQLPLGGSDWYWFDEHTGVEKIGIIWSEAAVPELDTIFGAAVRNQKDPGVISDPAQIATIQSYLKKSELEPPEVSADRATKLTTVKGRGDIIVNIVQLSHEGH
ncbi:MAG: protein kinase [Acidobacteriota bacterium]